LEPLSERARLRHVSCTWASDRVLSGEVGGEGINDRPGEPLRPSAASLEAATDAGMLPGSKRPSMARMVERPSFFMRIEGVEVRSMMRVSSLAVSVKDSMRGM
jgi:hypothetical protein